MAGSWQVIAATCHGVFSLFIRRIKHNGRYGSLFQKLWQRAAKSRDNNRCIEITMGITCHTCHAFSVFGLGTVFEAIATCHRTCHGLAIAGKSA
jgi:hypothetical protein